jgi:AbrB family looped-hinge helix DNA binding protein
MFTTTVTQKGQVTIPVFLREEIGLRLYGKVRLEPGDGHVKIYPQEDILDLAGKFKTGKGKSALKAREVMEKNYKRF